MKKDLERKILVIDEAWSLLSRAEDASYIFEIVKTCRKFNLALFLINQEVEGMLKSEAGRSVLANSSYTILMRQKPAVIENIQETFHLSNAERTFLLTAAVGEGIILMDDEHSEIRIIASEEEHKQITTNPDEILEQKKDVPKEQIPKKEVLKPIKQHSHRIKVNPEERFFLNKNLSLDDLKYLISKGYRKVKYTGIEGKTEFYLIKPMKFESDTHFCLIRDIVSYLKNFTDKIKTYEINNPDIVFEAKGKEYAIEVETGKLFIHKKKIAAKIRNLNSKFEGRWFFVLTNRRFYPKYIRLGETYTKLSIVTKIKKLFRKNENS